MKLSANDSTFIYKMLGYTYSRIELSRTWDVYQRNENSRKIALQTIKGGSPISRGSKLSGSLLFFLTPSSRIPFSATAFSVQLPLHPEPSLIHSRSRLCFPSSWLSLSLSVSEHEKSPIFIDLSPSKRDVISSYPIVT